MRSKQRAVASYHNETSLLAQVMLPPLHSCTVRGLQDELLFVVSSLEIKLHWCSACGEKWTPAFHSGWEETLQLQSSNHHVHPWGIGTHPPSNRGLSTEWERTLSLCERDSLTEQVCFLVQIRLTRRSGSFIAHCTLNFVSSPATIKTKRFGCVLDKCTNVPIWLLWWGWLSWQFFLNGTK